ncbi:hypothetical protein [Tautonia sociabilis]|uniref:Uncharacterized protein n=1 Tax=Tautonia sociabilis TaxID=2080755 RepID=A0A432MJ17_9BACT|nr:hypothetical protein [Tautonia sociabilis]RUL87195.1 hypothetical protein TsocGM_13275 [Tautonia sociabilis]
MRPSTWLLTAVLAGALCLGLSPSAPACPNCKDALAAQDPGGAGDVSAGYSRSILLMIAVPFVLFGSGTVAVVRLARKGGIPQL